MIDPGGLPRRSFVYRELEEAGAAFERVGDAAVAAAFDDDSGNEVAAAHRLGLADLSPLPRIGYKGRDALEWLAEQGLEIDEPSNRCYPQTDGQLLLKLAPTEALILPPVDRLDADLLIDHWTDQPGRLCYPVPRREGSLWFRVTGTAAPELFAKLCGVDLRSSAFADHDIAQTSVARMSAIVARDDIAGLLAFHVLADSASASYLWSCLSDSMGEFDGVPVGLSALRVLAGDED